MPMPLDFTALPAPRRVSPEDLISLAQRSGVMLQTIRDSMLQPYPRKQSPMFPSSKVAVLCEMDKTRFGNVLRKGELPVGQQEAPGRMRYFTLADTIAWVKATKPSLAPRPEGKVGKIICVGNFKGGVTKTTTSMVLGQGLTLRHGRKVLLVDLDPQGSTTTFFGINPHAEINAEQTVLPVIEGSQPDLSYAVMPTYWDNLDLIPSSTDLFNAEFLLPAKVHGAGGAAFQFWQVLMNALAPLRKEYDYILLDTAPTLSYLTINALFAADSVIVPVVPDTLSFASMVQFWGLFSDLVDGIKNYQGTEKKTFDSIDIVVTRMQNKAPAMAVRDWVLKTYVDHVLPVEIPETALAMSSSAEFSTAYDFPNWDGNAETYRRIVDQYDRLVDIIDYKTTQLWAAE
jgi:chromosome partitioning protein